MAIGAAVPFRLSITLSYWCSLALTCGNAALSRRERSFALQINALTCDDVRYGELGQAVTRSSGAASISISISA